MVKYLTMEEAISRALKDNNIIKANKYAVKKANWDVKRAWAELFPTISFNTRYNWIDQQTFAERDFRQYLPPELASQIPQTVFQESYYSSFDLYFPLFNGVLINGLSIAYEQETLSEQQSKSTDQQMVFNAISSYLNVLRNQEIKKLQDEFLELSKLNYEKAQRLYEANRYSQNDALRWEIDYQQQKSIVVNSKSELRSSLLALSRIINSLIDTNTVIDPKILTNLESEKEKLLNISNDEILNLINLTDEQLVEVNASLSALKSGEEISRLLHNNSYSSFMPKINLSYSYGWRENNTIDFDDYSPKNLMVTFSLPLFSGFQNYTGLKSSFYEYKKNQEEFKDQLLNTKLILNNVVNNIINIKTQIELQKSNLALSKNNYSIVERQRERGLVSNIDYIDAKLSMQNANIDYIGNTYNFIISIVELYYLTGKIESLIY
ncbi:MAG: TolC family protein [Ignavibacteriae bacterium]|nr:TolC family protein [Ignavibacteriota bacterium]MCB9208237.1 TolC family protein [Ignavibacteriales bacterium]MCB9258999.1 TolC family protein [Ignavibacteriales bacterium]